MPVPPALMLPLDVKSQLANSAKEAGSNLKKMVDPDPRVKRVRDRLVNAMIASS